MKSIKVLVFVWFAMIASGAFADVSIKPPFGEHMVLQQGAKVPLWGTAAPGEKVTVKFADQSVEAVTDANGKWRLELATLRASAEPRELVVSGNNTVTLTDVLVGEVWICSGQSNMQLTQSETLNAAVEAKAANYPRIRMFAAEKNFAASPIDDIDGNWLVCSPQSVGGFTGVGYFFARDLHKTLNVPVGLINIPWGGLRAEPFVSLAWLKQMPSFKQRADEYETYWTEKRAKRAAALAAGVDPRKAPKIPASDNSDITAVYNAMVHPLAPYAVRGTAWYQGESNGDDPEHYQELLTGLISCWRQEWTMPDMPFCIVQLANFKTRVNTPIELKSWADLRDAQWRTAQTVSHTGMVTAIDVGEEGIHPKDKITVGNRISRWAQAQVYGKQIEWSGPTFKSMKVDGGQAIITFDHAEGLKQKGDALPSFAIAGSDHAFYAADGKVEGSTVVLTCAKVAEPVAVRYAWKFNPACALYNGDDLPALPFRTDDWSAGDVKVGK